MDSAVTCRTLPWWFTPFFLSRSCTLLRRLRLSGLSGGFQRELCTCPRQSFRSLPLLSLYFVVLSAYDGYASTLFATSGPIESILGGVQGIFKNHSEHDSACDKMASSPSWSSWCKDKEDACGERKLSVAAVSCLSLCGLFLVLCWPCCHPVKSGNPLSACASTPCDTQVV